MALAKKQQISFELISKEYFIVRFKNYMNHDCLKEMNSLAQQGSALWNRDQKHWTVDKASYDKLLGKIVRIVKGDEEPLLSIEGKANLLNLQDVQIHAIPDFVFDLSAISIPFEKNLAFDQYMSKFKYENDFKRNYSLKDVPKTLRDNLFPF